MSVARLRRVEGFSPAAIVKLESSGITEAQALALGMYSVENAAVLAPNFEALPALVIPYYGTDGKPAAAHPTWPDFYRLRYLDSGVKGFAPKKQRYTQPPNTGVCAYFPSVGEWARIQGDPSEAILITEGEFKAAKATLEGFPTIGLGGVYNFRASSRGIFWLPELDAFVWPRRRVTIVYDSDYVEKPEICAAINALAEELQERGAIVMLATLPSILGDGIKTGLDDFLVERGDDALLLTLGEAEPLAMTSTLWMMNESLCYVRNPGFVVAMREDYKMAASVFTGHSAWATATTPERTVTPGGKVSNEKVPAAAVWLKWPLRQSARAVTYRPGEERFVDGDYNQWRGWGCSPKKGDIKPWLELIKFIFEGAEPAFVEWFLDWCAYPLKHPGTKLYSAMVVYGDTTGTGKTLIGYTLGKIYGKNFTKIENKHLKRDFNGWAENKQFILGDEISGSDKRAEADAMKTIITQEEVSINIKMLPEYSVPDCINYYFTSNHSDAFFIEDKDRRYAVHEVAHDEPLPLEFYKRYDDWKNGEGPSALFAHLLARDVSGFNPKAPAYRTAARDRMSMHGKSDIAVWCQELKEDPDGMLRLGQMRYTRDLFMSAELLAIYQAEHDAAGKVTKNGMARALAAAGFKQAYAGKPLIANGKQGRYFIIRHQSKWLGCKNAKELAKHIALPLTRN